MIGVKAIKWLVLIVLVSLSTTMNAAEWQWSMQIQFFVSAETNDHSRAFLWIPKNCKQVKSVIIGNHNMLEEGIFEHPSFRKKMTKLGVALIWITPGLGTYWEEENMLQRYQLILDSLAKISGYIELQSVPVIPMGHSAYATFPWNYAAWNPERTLAIISLKGDAPQTNLTGYGRANTEWSGRNIDGIPGLIVMGEYEWWEDRLTPAYSFRNKYPDACISLFADAGHGHFDFSDDLINYLGLFIEKALKYRKPKQIEINQPVLLKKIDKKDGWLADRWRLNELPRTNAATWHKYNGNKTEAFWYFDKEMAMVTEKYYNRHRSTQEQFIGFEEGGTLLPYNQKLHARYHLQFVPHDDGITFNVNAVFVDSTRTKKTGNKKQPSVDRICGPVKKLNDSTFRIDFYRMGLNNPRHSGDIWLLASDAGNKAMKSVVQQVNMRIPIKNTEGKTQVIAFDSIADIKTNTKSVKLYASSNSGLSVSFYVMEGPAIICGNKIKITKIPPRASFPIKVTVVAWQYGRSKTPALQTANTVSRTFYIQK